MAPTATADTPLPPAVCPECRAPIRLTLASDPSTPVYECGSTPYRSVHDGRWMRRPPLPGWPEPVTNNLLGLEPEEVDWMYRTSASLLRGAGRAISWEHDERIALGPCGHVTIAGECLALDDPGRAHRDRVYDVEW